MSDTGNFACSFTHNVCKMNQKFIYGKYSLLVKLFWTKIVTVGVHIITMEDCIKRKPNEGFGLEVEVVGLLKDDEKDGDADGDEAGAGGQHGSAVFSRHFCGGFRGGPIPWAFLWISLKSLSFLHSVHVGSGIWVEIFANMLFTLINWTNFTVGHLQDFQFSNDELS